MILTKEQREEIQRRSKNYLKPKSLKFLKDKGALNAAETREVIYDIERLHEDRSFLLSSEQTKDRYIGFLQSCLRSGEKWDGTIENFIAMEQPRIDCNHEYAPIDGKWACALCGEQSHDNQN